MLRADGAQNVTGDGQRLDELVLLEAGEQLDQFAKIAAIGQLKGIEIPGTPVVPYHQWKPPSLGEHQGGKCSRDSAVAVLERVDLRETMMQPRRLDLWWDAHVTFMELDQSIHFGRHVLRRTVFVNRAVGSEWIVGPPLVVASNQLNSTDPALSIGGFRPRLVARHEGMHLLDVARGQRPLTLHESENALYGGVVILDHGGNRLRMLAISVRDERRIYAPLDQQLRNSAVERVQALDQTSLDGPLAVQSLVESYERILRLQPFTLFLPHRGQMFQLRLCEILRVRLVVADEVPTVTHTAE